MSDAIVLPLVLDKLPSREEWITGASRLDWDKQYNRRTIYIKYVGFTVITVDLVRQLSTIIGDRKAVELCCGSGVLTGVLHEAGVDIHGVDLSEGSYSEEWPNIARQVGLITTEDCTANPYPEAQDIVLCWPPYSTDVGYKIAKNMLPGQRLFYCGEGMGGCTGDDDFHNLIDDTEEFMEHEDINALLNSVHCQFEGIHDTWYVYTKL